jgi:hypothetical protein
MATHGCLMCHECGACPLCFPNHERIHVTAPAQNLQTMEAMAVDEIEDVLATLTRDINRMRAGTGSWGPTPEAYAVALREYLRRGYHHGEAAKMEIEESDRVRVHAAMQVVRPVVDKIRAELEWALSVIEHEVKPPESCGACGTPNAACDGTCADAHYWAEHMRAIRALVAPIESEKPAP